jgi:hypothetical protein
MSNDLMKRVGRALESAASRDVQPAGRGDPAKGRALLARAQAVLGSKPETVSPPPPKPEPEVVIASPPPPSAERVKLPMMCSARGSSYVVIAERRGNELRFIGHEMPAPGPGGKAQPPGLLTGQYRIDAKGLVCPLCAARELWVCNCASMNGALHCVGMDGGRHHCACGKFESRTLVTVAAADVRGAAIGTRPGAGPSGFRQEQAQSKYLEISYEKRAR